MALRKKRDELKETDTVEQACDFYLHSPAFLKVSPSSQKQYESNLRRACKTETINGGFLGRVKLKDIRHKHIARSYDRWIFESGIRTANYIIANLSIVFNMCIANEVMLFNPAGQVKKQTPKKRKIKWTPEQVKTFLDTAYSKWEWRSIGLIVHMAYEWSQRLGDMRTLTWDEIDFDAQRLDLTQSKRGVDVHLPISDGLFRMLKQQHKELGFQPYVAPNPSRLQGAYKCYSKTQISIIINEIKKEANLPDELWGMDMRRTAITEMLEAGVDMAGIMQVSGHQSPQSMVPYMVNTYAAASKALSKRQAAKDER